MLSAYESVATEGAVWAVATTSVMMLVSADRSAEEFLLPPVAVLNWDPLSPVVSRQTPPWVWAMAMVPAAAWILASLAVVWAALLQVSGGETRSG
jgi:hypothetical protein